MPDYVTKQTKLTFYFKQKKGKPNALAISSKKYQLKNVLHTDFSM